METNQNKIFLDSKFGKVSSLYNKVEGSPTIVIIAHGYMSHKGSRTGTELAKRLNAEGISTINLDLYGHGESDGDITSLTVSKALESMLVVYDFIKNENYSKIGVVGSSFSGILSIALTTKRKIDVISIKCPVTDYKRLWEERLKEDGLKEWKEKEFLEPFGKKLHYGIYADSLQFNPEELGGKITCPILIIHGDKDTTIPLKHSQDFLPLVTSTEKKLHIVPNADHFFQTPNEFEDMISTSIAWLITHLK